MSKKEVNRMKFNTEAPPDIDELIFADELDEERGREFPSERA